MTAARNLALTMMTAILVMMASAVGLGPWDNGAALSQPAAKIEVGDILPREDVHIVTELGLYGLGRTIGDSEYAVARGLLIRIDPKTLKVLSILREQREILD